MPESGWWYIKDTKRQGPYAIADLENRLISEEISASTKVWRKGMDTWTNMADVDALRDILKGCPPPIDAEDDHATICLPDEDEQTPQVSLVAISQAGPWSRYFARQLDVVVFGAFGWIILMAMFPTVQQSEAVSNPAADAFLNGFLTLALGLLIEVPVFGLTGWTIGKFIFGITIRRVDGSKLSVAQVLRRNFVLWARGWGLGIPFANLVCLWRSYDIAKAGKRSSWDEASMHNVRQKQIGTLRRTAAMILSGVLVIGVSAYSQMEAESTRTSVNTSASKSQARTWFNPLTNVSAVLYAGWRNTVMPGKETPGVFLFENSSSAVVIGREVFGTSDISTYMDLLQANNSFGTFEDKRIELGAGGMTYYILTYRNVIGNNVAVRVDIKVWQTAPQNYWRTVVFSPLNNEKERAEARALASELEKTSLVETTGTFAPSGKRF